MPFILGIDYDEMRAVAREFERSAASETDVLTQAGQVSQAALDAWDGVASDEFGAQAQACAARSAPLPGMLTRIAGILRDTADIVQEAEERARREIEERLRRGEVKA